MQDFVSMKGKTAVITGGGSGIGRAMCHLFAAHGAKVFAVDLSAEQAQQTAASAQPAEGGSCAGVECDVASGESVVAAFAKAAAEGGRIDILVNNAGVGHVGNVLNTEGADFDRVVNVNMKGLFFCAKEAIKYMKADKKGGVILNIGSCASIHPIKDRFIYAATKSAVNAMTTSLATDFVFDGIRCNQINPGRIHTPFVDGFLSKNYPGKEKEMFQVLSEYMPIGRMAQPNEIADAALFLCSDRAAFITGTSLNVDGGIHGVDHPKVYGISNSHLVPPYGLSKM